MGMMLPAVCDNPECRAVFFFESPVTQTANILGGVFRVREGCPRCHSDGTVPHGKYESVKDATVITPHSTADRDFLEKVFGIARHALRSDLPAEEIARQANLQMPELSALWRLAPSNQQEAVQFWMLVLAVIGAILLAYQTFSEQAPVQIHLPADVVDAIQKARPGNPGDTRTGPSK
jgi:hypothetical protein